MKKILVLLISFILIICLCSCGSGGKSPDPSNGGKDPSNGGNGTNTKVSVTEPDSNYVVKVNDIEIEEYIVSLDGGEPASQYIQISGLKNKEVEKKINDEIRGVFDYFAEDSYTPPYKRYHSDFENLQSPKLLYKDVYTTVQANYEGILSLTVSCWMCYEDGLDPENVQSAFAEDTRTLNFNLNSGEQIPLSDLLIDGTELEYCNEKVRETLEDLQDGTYYYEEPISFDFKTLSEDSRYYIYSEDANPIFVFGYDTPGYTDDIACTTTLKIDISDVSALRTRFRMGKEFFESPSENYLILSNNILETELSNEYIEEYNNLPLSACVCRTISPNASKAVQEAAYLSDEEITVALNILEAQYDQYLYNYGEKAGVEGYSYIYSGIFSVGDYTSVEKSVANNIIKDGYNQYYSYTATLTTFKGSGDKPMGLDEIFRKESDYIELLKEGFKKNIDFYDAQELMKTPKQLDAFLEEKINSISGFGIETDGLRFTYTAYPEYDIAIDYFDDENIDYANRICEWVKFSDIGGGKNLTIFD